MYVRFDVIAALYIAAAIEGKIEVRIVAWSEQ